MGDWEWFLIVGAATSSVHVWMNGADVGYAQDSKLPHEFCVTKQIRAGKNLVGLEVVCWSDGAWLEDQDMWWLGGLTRSVRLLRRPQTFLRDVFLRPVFAAGAGTRLEVDAELTAPARLAVEVLKDTND